jgi:hypothetical protein
VGLGEYWSVFAVRCGSGNIGHYDQEEEEEEEEIEEE